MTPTVLAAALSERYRIQRELAAGGMATVYLAEDLKHHRQVAIKVLEPEVASTVGPERFLREIEIAAQLHHPHILPLYDSGEAGGFLYYVMPYVEGESLGRRLSREGELPVAEAVRILRDVADALAKAHAQGLVHRDIKPDNVLLADRHALVADFGVARAVSQAAAGTVLTRAGVALGTPAYMAPEQAAADPNVDHRADIYAFGCLAYEMLAGVPPFTGSTAQQVLAAHLTATPVPVTQHRAAVPDSLARLVMRCLEKKPADRWQSAEEIVAQLEAVLTPGGSTAPAPAQSAAAPRRDGSRRGPTVAAVLVAVIGLGWFAASRLASRQALDPNLLVVLPYRVTSDDPQLAVLREGMLDLMATYLTGEGGTLRAADPGTVMAAWRRRVGSDAGDLGEDDARDLARALGAGRLLTGSIVESGPQLLIRGAVTRLDRPAEPVQAAVDGPPDSLVPLITRFAGQVLARSSGVSAEASTGLTTSALPALRAYLRGQSEYRHGRYDAAVNRYSEALESDSTFALAGVGLLTAHGWTGSAAQQIVDVAQRAAWNGRDRLSARDRALVTAVLGPGGLSPSDRRGFLAVREQTVTIAGDRAEAWYYLGDEYFHNGALLGYDDALERAERALREAVARDSTVSGPIEHLLLLSGMRGDTVDVRRYLTLVSALSDSVERSGYAWFASVLLGDSVGSSRALRLLDSAALGARTILLGGPQMLLPFMPSHAAPVREAMLRRRQRALTESDRLRDAFALMLLEWDLGRPTDAAARLPGVADPALAATKIMAALFWNADTGDAIAAARRLESMGGGPTEIGTSWVGSPACALVMWHANRGEHRAAERGITRLRQAHADRDPSWPPHPNQVCASVVEAIEAQRLGRSEAARLVDALERMLLTVPYRPVSWENLALATLLENRGEYARAAGAARRHHYLWGTSVFFATHLRETGRLSELAGDTERAIEAYGEYLAIRYDPEPSVASEVAQVRQALERLTSERGAGRK
jgi:serine/threonine-protein kinase